MDQKAYEIAEKLVIASKRAYNRGIQTGSGGNVSARIPGTETMLVKASGGSLGDCTPEGFLITDFDGNVIEERPAACNMAFQTEESGRISNLRRTCSNGETGRRTDGRSNV